MLFIHLIVLNRIKQPPEKRRRLNINNNSKNLSSPSRTPLVYNYDSEEDEIIHQQSQDHTSYDQYDEGYITQPIQPDISKVVNPLKRKVPLSDYWVNFPGASSSALADVKITISDKVIALWKGNNTENNSIEVSIEDADLH